MGLECLTKVCKVAGPLGTCRLPLPLSCSFALLSYWFSVFTKKYAKSPRHQLGLVLARWYWPVENVIASIKMPKASGKCT